MEVLKEEEIRPADIFDKYLSLAVHDSEIYFPVNQREWIDCPSCGGHAERAFEKHEFCYDECSQCLTLFLNPRPFASAFARYYTESSSSKFWASTFYEKTADARREKLWKPKAILLKDMIQRYSKLQASVVDIGGGYGLFAEIMQAMLKKPVTVIEPASHLAGVCQKKGLHVVEKFLEDVVIADLPIGEKTFVSFELFEHLYHPGDFLDKLYGLMTRGDLFVFTTLSGIGADIRALWEDSKAVFPPHHLNFFNPYSIRLLLKKHQLEVLEVTTPGKLDVDIMRNNRQHIKDRFWLAFIEQASDEQMKNMQLALAENGLSSHMMVVCRKPT